MAISKSTVTSKKPTVPEPLPEIPQPKCPHHECGPCIHLYNSFEEAVIAVNNIHLKPGETHTSFYKVDNVYHCVVGIGNINPGKEHLILTDTGSNEPISEQISDIAIKANKASNDVAELTNNVIYINEQLERVKEDIQSQAAQISKLETDQTTIKSDIQNLLAAVKKIDTIQKQLNDYKQTTDASISELRNVIQDVSARISSELEPISDTSIASLFEDQYSLNLCCFCEYGKIDINGSKPVYNTYKPGDTVILNAVINESCEFAGWYKDGELFSTDENLELTFEDNNINVNATDGKFPEILKEGYSALFNKLYHITTSVNPAVIIPDYEYDLSGIVINVEGTKDISTARKDEIAHVTIDMSGVKPEPERLEFVKFEYNGKTTDSSVIDCEITKDTEFKAYFKEIACEVYVNENDSARGKVYGGAFVPRTTIQRIGAIPNDGYIVKDWTVNGAEGQHAGEYYFEEPIYTDMTYTANFEVKNN